MFGTDVATGKNAAAGYSSTGLSSAFTQSKTPQKEGEAQCYLWDILETCTGPQKQVLKNGTGIIENFILVGQKTSNGSVIFNNGTSQSGGLSISSLPSPASPTASSAGTTARRGSICTASLSTGVLAALALALC
jgi:hypothetical protein